MGCVSSKQGTDGTRFDKKFQQEVLEAHNKVRKNHGVSSLRLNTTLCRMAQRHAEKISREDSLAHSEKKDRTYTGQVCGENISMAAGTKGFFHITGEEITNNWYSEVSRYNFDEPGFHTGTGHFPQVVWKATKEIGVGKAEVETQNGDISVYVVANYWPAGNVLGHFQENVFPAKEC